MVTMVHGHHARIPRHCMHSWSPHLQASWSPGSMHEGLCSQNTRALRMGVPIGQLSAACMHMELVAQAARLSQARPAQFSPCFVRQLREALLVNVLGCRSWTQLLKRLMLPSAA
jgi:hypothetical protein